MLPIDHEYSFRISRFWSPHELARQAVYGRPIVTLLLGIAAVIPLPYGLFVWFGVAVGEPWGTWSGVWRDFLRILPCGLICPGLPLFGLVMVVSAINLLPVERRLSGPYAAMFVLAPLPIAPLIPTWLIPFSLVTLHNDIMADNSLDAVINHPVFQLFGSCFWLPVFLIIAVAIAIDGCYEVKRLLKMQATCCDQCGYDLRGSIPAGATACPECGEAIPQETKDRFNAEGLGGVRPS